MSGTSSAARRSRVSPARLTALRVLCRVDEDGAYANLELNQELRRRHLSAQDAAFATELVSGTLREQLFYDGVIESASDRKVNALDVVTRNILRLSAHQLLSLSAQAYAAVNEAVELQKSEGNRGAAGLVNAVLRRVAERSKADWMRVLTSPDDTEDRVLSLRFSHPEWMIRALREALESEGRETELEELLAAHNDAPLVNLVAFPLTSQPLSDAELSELLPDSVSVSGPSPLGAVMRQGSPATVIRASHDSARVDVRVQDQGSQLAALALTRASRDSAETSEAWLDLCSGPGGKTAILAAEASRAGATLRAVELSEHRARLVTEAVSRSPISVQVVTGDGTSDDAFGGESYDRILLDAPCTGLGALRRRPDARLRKVPADVPELVQVQRALLAAAVRHLKPGGLLAYVTCSPLLAETRLNVESVLAAHPELVERDASDIVTAIAREPLELASSHKSVQLWPHRHGTDAMFIALLQRRLDS